MVEKDKQSESLLEIKLLVPENLHNAFQRCTWIMINENGGSQLEIMKEVIHDFLIKHEC